MGLAIVIALVLFGGTALARSFDDRASGWACGAVGAPVGLTAFGLLGCVIEAFFASHRQPVLLSAIAVGLAGIVALRAARRRKGPIFSTGDAPGSRPRWGQAVYLGLALGLLLVLFRFAVVVRPDGLYTNDHHSIHDLPFHLGIVSAFVARPEMPPEHPEFAGVRLTYPFLADFVVAQLIRAGASLEQGFVIANTVLALSLFGLLLLWARRLTGDALAACLTPPLVLLSGGLGWWLLVAEAPRQPVALLRYLVSLPHDFTISVPAGLRWGNALTALLIPQRAFLLGLPLAIVVWYWLWDALTQTETDEDAARARRMMAGAGLVTGLMPIAHLHSYAAVVVTALCLALLFPRPGAAWLYFFAPALLLSVPQLLWLFHDSAVKSGAFFAIISGWGNKGMSLTRFWFWNTGLFFPCVAASLLWRWPRPTVPDKLLRFLLPFGLFFVIPNIVQLAPWRWDNIKFLFFWYLSFSLPVALLLSRLWGLRRLWARGVAAALMIALTLAGALDVWRLLTGAAERRIFDDDDLRFAETIRRKTPPDAIVLHAPTVQHPVYLTGRRSLLGLASHIRNHGLDPRDRQARIAAMYGGAWRMLRQDGVEFMAVGPAERECYAIDEAFLERMTLVGKTGRHRLYRADWGRLRSGPANVAP